MKRETLKKELPILIAAFLLCTIMLLCLAGLTKADENMPVTCYKGSSRIGTVTVFDWKTAAAACNNVLYDCRGACMGCFSDSDYISDVCVDTSGSTFLR